MTFCVCVICLAARRLEPGHSFALGALGTVLTQQGRFQAAWDILDARVRPQLTAKDLRTARGRGIDTRPSVAASAATAKAPAAAAGARTAAVEVEADGRGTAESATTAVAAAGAAADPVEPAAADLNEKQPWWKFGIGRFAGKYGRNA